MTDVVIRSQQGIETRGIVTVEGAIWGFVGSLSPSPHAKGIKTMTTVNGLMDKE